MLIRVSSCPISYRSGRGKSTHARMMASSSTIALQFTATSCRTPPRLQATSCRGGVLSQGSAYSFGWFLRQEVAFSWNNLPAGCNRKLLKRWSNWLNSSLRDVPAHLKGTSCSRKPPYSFQRLSGSLWIAETLSEMRSATGSRYEENILCDLAALREI